MRYPPPSPFQAFQLRFPDLPVPITSLKEYIELISLLQPDMHNPITAGGTSAPERDRFYFRGQYSGFSVGITDLEIQRLQRHSGRRYQTARTVLFQKWRNNFNAN